MIHSLSSLVSKYTLFAVCASSIVAINDVSRVVLPISDDSLKSSLGIGSDHKVLPQLDSKTKQRLVEQYRPYDSAGRKARKKAELLAQQAEQTEAESTSKKTLPNIDDQEGELLALYTDTARLSLKAVITDDGRFALLELVAHDDDKVSILQLSEGDDYEGFVLESLNQTSVTLTRKTKTIELVMYKRNRLGTQ